MYYISSTFVICYLYFSYIPYQPSPANTKYSRQSQSILPQTNGESTKSMNHKSYEKRVQNVNTSKPSIHQSLDDDNNSSQTNIVTTVIVNNSNIDSSANETDENLNAINNSNNKKFDVKIEQHIVSMINENFKENDIPCVNIKSSIEVKQNGNDNKECDETISRVKTPTMASNAATRTDEDFENKEVKETPTTENILEINEVSLSTSPANAANKSWASLLKNESEPHVAVTSKPTAHIAPNNVMSMNREQAEQFSAEKAHSTPKSYQNKLFSITENSQQKNDMSSSEQCKSVQAEAPPAHCDDPIIYRMGGKFFVLKNY